MKKIFVTGGRGQLGIALSLLTFSSQYEFIFSNSSDLDLSQIDQIEAFFKGKSYDGFLHCAAYTAVDLAETETALCFAINKTASEKLAEIAHHMGAFFIYISTDYVFDGQQNKPWNESDPTHPLSVYGKSKRAGEIAILNANPKSIILRTSWLHGKNGKNFVKTILKLAQEKSVLKIVADQIGSPTSVVFLAQAITYILEFLIKNPDFGEWGIFHCSQEGVASWYDLAYFVVQKKKINCEILPQKTSDYPTAAQRPLYSVLDKTKIKQVFDLKIPHWSESLAYLEE